MRAVRLAVVLVVLLTPALVQAQAPPAAPDPDDLLAFAQRKLEEYGRNPVEAYEDVSGEQVDREDVRMALAMDFRVLDFDALGMVFGGGTLDAQARLTGRVEFRVLSVERISRALRDAGLDPCAAGYCHNRSYVTADVFRNTLAGEALAAVEAEEQRRVQQLILATFPDITVLATSFAWSNTNPAINGEGDPPLTDPRVPSTDDPFYARLGTQRLKEPPIVLDVAFDLQYVQRVALLDLLREAPEGGEEGRGLLESREGFLARNAFHELGLEQELELDVPAGWDVLVALRLPPGYTFEQATPEVIIDGQRRLAQTSALAGGSDVAVVNPVAVSLTNRFLVAAMLLGVAIVGGLTIRIPAILLATRLRYGRAFQTDARGR